MEHPVKYEGVAEKIEQNLSLADQAVGPRRAEGTWLGFPTRRGVLVESSLARPSPAALSGGRERTSLTRQSYKI